MPFGQWVAKYLKWCKRETELQWTTIRDVICRGLWNHVINVTFIKFISYTGIQLMEHRSVILAQQTIQWITPQPTVHRKPRKPKISAPQIHKVKVFADKNCGTSVSLFHNSCSLLIHQSMKLSHNFWCRNKTLVSKSRRHAACNQRTIILSAEHLRCYVVWRSTECTGSVARPKSFLVW